MKAGRRLFLAAVALAVGRATTPSPKRMVRFSASYAGDCSRWYAVAYYSDGTAKTVRGEACTRFFGQEEL